MAFFCASLGPMLGRVALLVLIVPVPDPSLRAMLAVTSALGSLGPFGLLMGVLAGVVAASRVAR